MEPKGKQIEPRNPQKHYLRNKFEKLEVLMDSWDTKREPFLQTSIKTSTKNHSKQRSPQNMESDAKWVPKWCPNQCPNSLKINAKIGNGKIVNVIKIHVLPNGKIMQIHCKTKNSIQMDTKIHAKFMKDRSSHFVRKSSTNNSKKPFNVECN